MRISGTIKNYNEKRGFGFIYGDNRKDYFFHHSSFNKDKKPLLGTNVEFFPKHSVKGLLATKIEVDRLPKKTKYLLPYEIFTSEEETVKGWETIEHSNWTVTGSDSLYILAKANMLKNAQELGMINALVNVEYFKTRDFEVRLGRGIYSVTIHNFRGIGVNIGKLSHVGTVQASELGGLDNTLASIKEKLRKKTWLNILSTLSISIVLSVMTCNILYYYSNFTDNVFKLICLGVVLVVTSVSLGVGYENYHKFLERKK